MPSGAFVTIMENYPIERLSGRRLEALKLYADRYPVKEIAQRMGVSENTVSSYLTEAGDLIGGGRKGAVAALRAYEAAHPNPGGALQADEIAPSPTPTMAPRKGEEAASTPVIKPLPIRQGTAGNDLSIAQRFIWIFNIAAAIAIGFGAIASTIRIASDIIAGQHHGQ